MSEDRSETVEIFDLDRGQATPEPDEWSQGRERSPFVIMDRWPWWRRTSAPTHWLAAVGVAGLVVAAVAGYGVLTAHPGKQYFVNQETLPAAPVTVDALGCPATATCAIVAVPSPIVSAIRHVVPSGRITYAQQSVDARSGQVFRREIDLSAARTTMRIVSECVPGSGPVPAQAMTLTVATGTGPEPRVASDRTSRATGAGHRRFSELRPGAPGCSLSTEADTTLTDDRLDHQSVGQLLVRIAADPALMVTR